jgi:precorrin-6B methylase 2
MTRQWTSDEIAQLARAYQPAAILAAAADLDLFTALCARPLSAEELAHKLSLNLRSLVILLDVLTALQLLEKQSNRYSVPPSVADCLTPSGSHSTLGMTQHQANCMRRWSELARTIKTGSPAYRGPSVRGEAADKAAFIQAMNDGSGPIAQKVVADLQPLEFNHLLDVGGASGTWTIAFLRANPSATATLFDLPHVIPMAHRLLSSHRLIERVKLVAGNFATDQLPAGADLAWISAILHQDSRIDNRKLLGKCFHALIPGGQVLIRDMVMDESRTAPLAGALFAVNMLAGTERGGTFTFKEMKEDLESAGFVDVIMRRKEAAMSCVVSAKRP